MARVSSEQRRRDLTAAAVALIVEEGPVAVSARKIADRAGAPLGIVHYTFRDMDELTHLANTEVLAIVFGALRGVRTDLGVRGFVGELLRTYLRFMQENEKEALAFFETFVSLIRTERAEGAVIDGVQFILGLLQEAEKHDSQPSRIPLAQLATLLTMTTDGLSLIHLARRDHRQSERDVEQLITAIQHLV